MSGALKPSDPVVWWAYCRVGGRPRINIELYKAELVELFQEGLTYEELVEHIQEHYNIIIARRTLQRRFQQWGTYKRSPTILSEDLQRHIQVLFFEVGLNDHDMLIALQDEGFKITKTNLVSLRFKLNLRRRIGNSADALAYDNNRIRKLIYKELAKGQIEGYGYRYIHTHFRQQGHIAARTRLYQHDKEINPIGVQ